MGHSRRAGLVLTVMTVLTSGLALAACGGDGSSGTGGTATDPPTSSTTTSGSASTDPSPTGTAAEGCPYLTQDEVSAAVGAQTHETAGTLHACFFDPVDGGPSVMLSRVDVQIDPTDYATQTRALCEGDITDVDAGDEAFACVMGLGPQGQVYAGRVLVTVNVNGAVDDATGITMAAALLHDVTIPPES